MKDYFLYVTADEIGTESGGGVVTRYELEALKELAQELDFDVRVFSRKELKDRSDKKDPWCWDHALQGTLRSGIIGNKMSHPPRLAHFYSGTFSESVAVLKESGSQVSYTIAAHDIQTSREEHFRNGIPYDDLYPHLVQKELWNKYKQGYLDSHQIIVPSPHSKKVVQEYDRYSNNPIEIIPHGVSPPDHIPTFPRIFAVGYMGAIGPDKGLSYLISAWQKLGRTDAILVLAGKDSRSDRVMRLIQSHDAKNVVMLGWVNKIENFFANISVYVQPSVTEGFGIEVLEAAAHGRPVLCSTGAGASYYVPKFCQFGAGDIWSLASKLEWFRKEGNQPSITQSKLWTDLADNFTWDKIKEHYKQVWKRMLA